MNDLDDLGRFFGVLAVFFALWGWIVVPLVVAWLVGKKCYAFGSGSRRRKRRVLLIVVLVLFAACWYRVSLPYTFGQYEGTIVSANGVQSADVVLRGRHHCVTVDGTDRNFLIWSRPKEVFWMRGGTAVGVVDAPTDSWGVIEVGLLLEYFDSPETTDVPKVDEFHYPRHTLTPAEREEFEAARQLAERQGRLWRNSRHATP